MRQYLNNPAVVIPLSLVAILWGTYSYGLIDWLSSKFLDSADLVLAQSKLSKPSDKLDCLSADTMKALSRDSWLISNWIRESSIKNEPFIADYYFDNDVPPPPPPPVSADKNTVIVDQQTFEAAIATKLGLDGKGFFVVFENVLNLPIRKRVGDTIYLVGNGPLKIPTIGIAERSRTADERKEAIELACSKMKLQGVGTQASVSGVGEGLSGESDSKNIAFIQIEGTKLEIYRQGDLVYRDPSIGLDKIIKGELFDSVVLVDAEQNEYILRTSNLQ